MRLFIAREAVDTHFSIAFPIVAPESSFSTRINALVKAAPFYMTWYPARWIPSFKTYGDFGKLAGHMRFVDRTTRKLGRSLFHAMVRFGPKLERKQMVLFRAVDIGAELFAMAAACSRAVMLASKLNQPEAIQLADAFCAEARGRIEALFKSLYGPHDEQLYKVAMSVLKGEHAWLEQGIANEEFYEESPVMGLQSDVLKPAVVVHSSELTTAG
jgi:ACAD9/ACADV-like protein